MEFATMEFAAMGLALLLWLAAPGGIEDRETLRFACSSEQGFDTSCGLSALACLLKTYWGRETSELELAEECFGGREEGDYTVSLAGLKGLLVARGFVAAACQMSYAQLAEAAANYPPVLVHYDAPKGHFALVLAVKEEGVITADPAEGTIILSRGDFEGRWSGYAVLAARADSRPEGEAMEAAIAQCMGRDRLLERVEARGFREGGAR
jgi:predicted double-glycine peptidase